MKYKKLILLIVVVISLYINAADTFGADYVETGDFVNKSGRAIMIYSAMIGTPTENYLLENQNFTIDWIEYDYYGTDIVAVTLEDGTGGFLFIKLSEYLFIDNVYCNN